MTDKILYTGKTRTTGGPSGAARSHDGTFAIDLPEPHPAAEQLFATAWSACFIGAIGLAAQQRRIRLTETPAIDAQVDLVMNGGVFDLRARLDVEVPGVDPETARELVEAAHEICPYSRATRGNVAVELNVVEAALAA